MKKSLKYTSLLVITLLCIFAFNGNVNALCNSKDNCPYRETTNRTIYATGTSANENYVKNVSTTGTKTTDSSRSINYYTQIRVYNGTGDKEKWESYTFPGINDTNGQGRAYLHKMDNMAIYCLDPDASGLNSLYARRFLISDGVSAVNNAFDIAVMSALVNGERSDMYSDDYFSTNMAIRAITSLWGFTKTGSSNLYKAYYGQVYYWYINYPEVSNAYQTLMNAGSQLISVDNLKAYENYQFYPGWDNASNAADPTGLAILNKARTLFINALSDAAKWATYEAKTATVEKDASRVAVSGSTTDYDYTLHLKNFTNDGKASFVINGINTASVGNHKPQIISVTIDDGKGNIKAWSTNPGTQNLLNNYSFESDDITITIRVRFNENLQCGQNLEYAYYDSGSNGPFGDYVGVVWSAQKAGASHQRFLSVEEKKKDESGNNKPTPGTLELTGPCSCSYLKDSCVNEYDSTGGRTDGAACQQLLSSNCGCEVLDFQCNKQNNQNACNRMKTECTTCDTTYTTFNCCNENNELIVSTVNGSNGYTEDEHEVGISGPEDVKACFVTQVDNQCKNADGTISNCTNIAGIKDQESNTYSYQDTKDGIDLKGNKYCEVSCKEDYLMTMPTGKVSNSGRYFTFKAKVNGTKTCYTNTIQREQYNKDIADAQEELVNAYNEWLLWYTAYNDTPKTDQSSSKDPCCDCTCPAGVTSCGSCCCCYTTGTCTHYSVSGQISTRDVSYKNSTNGTITLKNTTMSYSYGRNEDKDGGHRNYACGGSCSSGNPSTLKSKLKTEKLDPAEKRLKAAQEAFNNIIKMYKQCTSWDTEIKYDAEVYYEYGEAEYMDKIYNYGNMEESVTAPSTSAWYCNSTVYSNGTEVKANLIGDGYDKCDKNTNSYVETSIDYIYCVADASKGCYVAPEKISNARYKKVTSEVTANYRPATLFYNTYTNGDIKTNDQFADDKVALENKLPVALNRKRGIYLYSVNIKNLGEFYDRSVSTDNLGRYVGSSTAVVDTDKLEYACNYITNIDIDNRDVIYCTASDNPNNNCSIWKYDCDVNKNLSACKAYKDNNCGPTQCDGPNCISVCIGPNCEDYCDGTDCIANCIGIGCVYDEGGAGTSFFNRTISLNNMFPSNSIPYNWANAKGIDTIDEIENGEYYVGNDTSGNKIYDSTPILSLTIDPSTAREIKKYNACAEGKGNSSYCGNADNGGYSNNTISCEAKEGYQEIACYSSFIDDLLNGKYGNSVVNNNSFICGNADRSGNRSVDNYFKLWPGTKSEDLMMGPSWK